GVKFLDLSPGENNDAARRKMVDTLVAHGVRAQLRSGNLLTGAMFVAFDFFPDQPPATVDWSQSPPQLPTVPGTFEAIEAQVVSTIQKLNKVPFKDIGDDAKKALADLDQVLIGAHGTLNKTDVVIEDAGKIVEPNSVLGAQLGNTLEEVSRAARDLRMLAD